MTDPYEILGLSPDSDDTTIRKRYLELVKLAAAQAQKLDELERRHAAE